MAWPPMCSRFSDDAKVTVDFSGTFIQVFLKK